MSGNDFTRNKISVKRDHRINSLAIFKNTFVAGLASLLQHLVDNSASRTYRNVYVKSPTTNSTLSSR